MWKLFNVLVKIKRYSSGQKPVSRKLCLELASVQNAEKVNNRPLALGGHVTNASFKQWVGILLMPKIDRARKTYPTAEIWRKRI